MDADPAMLLDDAGMLDPFRCWDVAMRNEKPGGHGERAVAMGALDMALWDLRAKAEDLPLCRLLADRFRGGDADAEVAVYAAGGYYRPGATADMLADEGQGYLDLGSTAVEVKLGAAPVQEALRRIEPAIDPARATARGAVDANTSLELTTAIPSSAQPAPLGD